MLAFVFLQAAQSSHQAKSSLFAQRVKQVLPVVSGGEPDQRRKDVDRTSSISDSSPHLRTLQRHRTERLRLRRQNYQYQTRPVKRRQKAQPQLDSLARIHYETCERRASSLMDALKRLRTPHVLRKYSIATIQLLCFVHLFNEHVAEIRMVSCLLSSSLLVSHTSDSLDVCFENARTNRRRGDLWCPH